MKEAIEAKLNELFGPRCEESDLACPVCWAWQAYDDLMLLIEEAQSA